ncbi:Glycoprotein gp2 [Serinicoccus hydrothermalis]|uniref:Glycoprotein gp2 n=1 Tax=Serinicoccus hydrothermalis TaxID=1758689 RepID=A0A1B1NA22_9MICO|nr:Glycoprotein gp2 [Serinicoccus hydrothermalis]
MAAAVIWFGVSRGLGDEPGDTAQETTATQDDAEALASAMDGPDGEESAEADTGDAPEETTEEPAATQTEQAQDAGMPEEVTACLGEVSAGTERAAAAAESAEHWRTHYTQMGLIESGEITPEEAAGPWAETREAGPQDQERFSAAQAAYEDSAGSCADLDVAGAAAATDDLDEGALQACVDRSAALALVGDRGAAVNEVWSGHLVQMRSKDEADPEAYQAEWLAMVDAAPETMEPYDAAVAELEEAPACELSS